MKTTGLLDADLMAYKLCAVDQQSYDFGDGEDKCVVVDFENVKERAVARMEELTEDAEVDELIVCLSDDYENWRNSVWEDYKANRSGTTRPELLYDLKEWLFENFKSYRKPTLEADDVMGILSTHPKLIKGKKVIISEDKDMNTIPGFLYNPNREPEGVRKVSEGYANYFWMFQTVTGDTTDGYKGCPGAGPVAANNILNEYMKLEDMWNAVVDLYASKGYDEELALQNARMARICRYTDYDFKERRVIPWEPNF